MESQTTPSWLYRHLLHFNLNGEQEHLQTQNMISDMQMLSTPNPEDSTIFTNQ